MNQDLTAEQRIKHLESVDELLNNIKAQSRRFQERIVASTTAIDAAKKSKKKLAAAGATLKEQAGQKSYFRVSQRKPTI